MPDGQHGSGLDVIQADIFAGLVKPLLETVVEIDHPPLKRG